MLLPNNIIPYQFLCEMTMLKTTQELIDFLDASFTEGGCTCIRCKSDNHSTSPHDFILGGAVYRRLYACSSREDLLRKVMPLLVACAGKNKIESLEGFPASAFRSLLGSIYYQRFLALAKSNGLIHDTSNDWISLIAAQPIAA